MPLGKACLQSLVSQIERQKEEPKCDLVANASDQLEGVAVIFATVDAWTVGITLLFIRRRTLGKPVDWKTVCGLLLEANCAGHPLQSSGEPQRRLGMGDTNPNSAQKHGFHLTDACLSISKRSPQNFAQLQTELMVAAPGYRTKVTSL